MDWDDWAKPVAVCIVGFATFAISFPIACYEFGADFARTTPHDGQDALGALVFGFITALLLAPVGFGITIGIYALRAWRRREE
jgi:hypothetical protein